MPGLDGTIIDGLGTVRGGRVAIGGEPGAVGAMLFGRPTSEVNLRACRKFLMEARVEEFGTLEDGGWFDKGSGLVYDVLGSDPLFHDRPGELADLFVANGTVIAF